MVKPNSLYGPPYRELEALIPKYIGIEHTGGVGFFPTRMSFIRIEIGEAPGGDALSAES